MSLMARFSSSGARASVRLHMHSPGIDAGEVPPPIPRIATPELFFSFEIGSLEFPHGNNPARDTRDIG